MNKKTIILIVLILGIIFISSCAPKPLSKCGDGICSPIERQKGICQQDCEPAVIKTCSQQNGDVCTADETCPTSYIKASDTDKCCPDKCTITPRGKCGDGICGPVERQKGICPQDCEQVPSCVEDWQCTSWSDCINNQQTRTCTDKNNCGTTKNKPSESQNCEEQIGEISSLNLLKTTEIENGARPEIVVTQDRVFVIYLDTSSGRVFNIKIYDKDMTNEIASKTLVSGSSQYGSPTDIRIVSDSQYLYMFYETANTQNGYLFGAKYTLDDNFERVAYTDMIASGKLYTLLQSGDERMDDPAPMIEGDNIYVMTRYFDTLKPEGITKYRLYEFDKNLNKQSEFSLDLSTYADGGSKQASIIYDNGYYYMVMPTTSGTSNNVVETVEWTVPMNVLMVELDKNWNVVDSKIIANEGEYSEGYVTGLKSDDKYFYITYSQVILGVEFSSTIKIYDKDWNNILTKKYLTGDNLRPSIYVTTDRVYAGNNIAESKIAGEGTTKAVVYVFEKK